MFNVGELKDSIQITVTSEYNLVDRIIHECRDFLYRYNVTQQSNVNLLIRELVINAIEHGNKCKKDKKIEVKLESIRNNMFKLAVEDEGDGFNYTQLSFDLPENPQQTRNRGFALINLFSDKIDFNDKGNQVTVFFSNEKKVNYEIKNEDGFTIISPTGDLTAESGDDFRNTLLEKYDDGETNFIFDLRNVSDIDSISLSIMIVFAKMIMNKNQPYKLRIVNVCQELMNFFRITQLDKIYDFDF